MHNVLRVAVIILLFVVNLNCAGLAVNINVIRPRLIVNSCDVVRIRHQVTNVTRHDYIDLCSYVSKFLVYHDACLFSKNDWIAADIRALSFVALVSDNARFIDAAVEYGIAIAQVPPSWGSDIGQRQRLEGLSYIYDWQYEYLTIEQKEIISGAILSHLKHLRYFADKPFFSGGHSRYGNAAILAGIVAVYGDDVDFDFKAALEKQKVIWELGYNPVQSFIGQEGGYHMGWRYGPAYTTALPYLIWTTATGEDWRLNWRLSQVDWLIYGLRGDGSLPRSGDCWNSDLIDSVTSDMVAISAGKFNNPYAEYFYRKYFSDIPPQYNVFRIAFYNQDLQPKSYEFDSVNYPLARCFRHAGFVVARDGWGKDSSQLVFKSSLFDSINHQHKDQNSFELSYRGSLLIDSGAYYPPAAYGSEHWKNYYTRTIAHNSMVVYDPDEEFILFGEKLSNDGGQKFADYAEPPIGYEPSNLKELLSSKYRLGGITGFRTIGGATWMQGDASRAYNSKKVALYLRDIVMINRPSGSNHPVVIIFDDIKLNKELNPKILFHSNGKPQINKTSFRIDNLDGGALVGHVLLPHKASLDLVGGKGREWCVNGVNYELPIGWQREASLRKVDPGACRVEVSGGFCNKRQYLTFIEVLDRNDQLYFLPLSFQGAGFSGVEFADSAVLWLSGAERALVKLSNVKRLYVVNHGYVSDGFIINGKRFAFKGEQFVEIAL